MHATPLRRPLAVTASAGLIAVLAVLPAGPASAAVTGTLQASASVDSTGTAGNTCAVTSGPTDVSIPPFAIVAGSTGAEVSFTTTFQSSTDVNDVTTVATDYAGETNLVKSHGDLRRLTLTGTGSSTIDRAEGAASHCKTTSQLNAVTPLTFTEAKPGWLLGHLEGTQRAQLLELQVTSVATSATSILHVYEGGPASADDRGFVTPGSYSAVLATAAFSSGVLTKVANRGVVSVSYYPTGAAPKATHGSGKAFVRFPGSLSCGKRSATLTWTPKADRVASATILVNGVKKASVRGPAPGARVALRHLAAGADNTVVARLSLKGGGHASASRAYLPCQG